ncbi:DNA recombination protein RmuC [Lyticum sinuosum]|uniref:DNA recombination protein RmuC homolog n=1 Tax=Lyticum sinuosum TaxID=1332059 RepID=A0AAE4VLZ6_9RICK|nr:DNA recombination protein RmuC [Lyticum sinuosum]MDZ5761321.1 DNA recombination protein RmuC [Lyticum sinuosum]
MHQIIFQYLYFFIGISILLGIILLFKILKKNSILLQEISYKILIFEQENQKIIENLDIILTQNNKNYESLMIIDQAHKYISDIIHHSNQHNDNKLENIRKAIDYKLDHIQNDTNNKIEIMRQVIDEKLETIRLTVDEKLQTTLEKRLKDSFDLVSRRLEIVHRGLGEMQSLANNVGDLKNILTNVKTRGIWGEVQLESILSQILLPVQYEKNFAINPKSTERVEFAIKLPGGENGMNIFLPIDAKFPMSDYERLINNHIEENNNQQININNNINKENFIESENIINHSKIYINDKIDKKNVKYIKNLENFIKKSAKSISEKYIIPPYSTDFAIMFIPVESVYSEALQIPGIIDEIQREYRVVIAGPTTLSAILNSLRMGFRTLAIAEKSSKIWEILEIIKKDFNNFSVLLSKTKLKLDQASEAISLAEKRSIAIESRLTKFSRHETRKISNTEDK